MEASSGWSQKRFAPLVLLALTAACGSKQQLPTLPDLLGAAIAGGALDRDITSWNELADPRDLVPIIVAGVVQENRVVAKRIEARRYKNVFLDLHEVRCQRENSLKGEVAGNEFTFFYYADRRYLDKQNPPVYRRMFQADAGRRYIFFLTRDAGVLRSIGDVGNYSIPVQSGKHDEGSVQSSDAGKRIAEILLTRGHGADPTVMSNALGRASRAADVWGSRLHTATLLRGLLSSGEPLRSTACSVLIENFNGQYDCLEAIAKDPSEPEDNRRGALKTLEEKSELRRLFGEDLKDPAALTFQEFADDSRHRLREEFETLLLNETDRIQHRRACQALSRYFPWDAEPQCASTKLTTK